jgi:hypothetical protein
MNVKITKGHRIIYSMKYHQIEVDINGVQYLIRQQSDDNGCEYYVHCDNLNDGDLLNIYDMEDGELKNIIIKLAEAAHDDSLFADSNVGKDIDLEELDCF